MCIAIWKPKGIPFDSFLEEGIKNSYRSNKDGMGFGLKRNGEIIVRKGLFEPEQMIKYIKDLNPKPEEEMVIHLRIRTAGDIIDKNCHPFILNTTKEICWNDNITTDDPILIHNGGFMRNEYEVTDHEYSDTFHLTHQYFSNPFVKDMMYNDLKMFERITKPIISYNKVVIMFPEENQNTIVFGDFKEDNGVYFSTGAYKNWERTDHIRSNISKNSKNYGYSESSELKLLGPPTGLPYSKLRKNIKAIGDLSPNLVLEVINATILEPIGTEPVMSILKVGDLVRLGRCYQGVSLTTKEQGVYWKASFINPKNPEVPATFSIPEITLTGGKHYRIVLKEDGTVFNPTGKVAVLTDNEYVVFRSIFDKNPDNISRSTIKKIEKAIGVAGMMSDRKANIKVYGKVKGPFPLQFYKNLLQEIGEVTYEQADLFKAGE